MNRFLPILVMILMVGCQSSSSQKHSATAVADTTSSVLVIPEESNLPEITYSYDTTQWVELINLDPSIKTDIRYATDNNFVDEVMYDCGKCFLRPEAARAIVKAQAMLKRDGYGLLMFDCYRPKPFQQKLWDKVPDPRYVTPPHKGSMHGRGLAVDLTLIDPEGKEADMGTDFDFFGERAYQTNTDLPENVLANRRLLNETMAAVGFSPIRTEWWHFSFRSVRYDVSDWVWPCP